mgnify:CR=1 FL=1
MRCGSKCRRTNGCLQYKNTEKEEKIKILLAIVKKLVYSGKSKEVRYGRTEKNGVGEQYGKVFGYRGVACEGKDD